MNYPPEKPLTAIGPDEHDTPRAATRPSPGPRVYLNPAPEPAVSRPKAREPPLRPGGAAENSDRAHALWKTPGSRHATSRPFLGTAGATGRPVPLNP